MNARLDISVFLSYFAVLLYSFMKYGLFIFSLISTLLGYSTGLMGTIDDLPDEKKDSISSDFIDGGSNESVRMSGDFDLSTADMVGSYSEANSPAPAEQINYHAALEEDFNLTLHPGTKYEEDGKIASLASIEHCESLVYKALSALPEEPVQYLKHLTLFYADYGRRGLGGGNTVVLRCQNVTDEELVGVLVHELGHIMDTGVFQGSVFSGKSAFKDGDFPVYNNDESVGFYNISWKNETEIKEGYSVRDFVSGYAMTDPFEDFAESYAYYILHGSEFRRLARYNESLKLKYQYLKNYVFEGEEYVNGQLQGLEINKRSYDVTVLPYDLKKLFAI